MRDKETEGNGAENAVSSHANRYILDSLSNMVRQVVD